MKKEILDILYRPFAPEEIKQRVSDDGKTLDYVDVPKVIKRLDEAFEGDWSFGITSGLTENIVEGTVFVVGELVISATERNGLRLPIRKSSMGCNVVEMKEEFTPRRDANGEPIKGEGDKYVVDSRRVPKNIEMAIKGAEADSLKRCARMLGIGLHLYDRDALVDEPRANSGASVEANKMITDMQKEAIVKLVSKKTPNVDADTILAEIAKKYGFDNIDKVPYGVAGKALQEAQ